MARKRHRARERLSPTDSVAHLTDDLISEMQIPALPDGIPKRLADAMRSRVEAYLFHLRQARSKGYVLPFEVRLIRDAHQAVLAAVELHLADSTAWYATFRQLVEELGYERTDVGFAKDQSAESDAAR